MAACVCSVLSKKKKLSSVFLDTHKHKHTSTSTHTHTHSRLPLLDLLLFDPDCAAVTWHIWHSALRCPPLCFPAQGGWRAGEGDKECARERGRMEEDGKVVTLHLQNLGSVWRPKWWLQCWEFTWKYLSSPPVFDFAFFFPHVWKDSSHFTIELPFCVWHTDTHTLLSHAHQQPSLKVTINSLKQAP